MVTPVSGETSPKHQYIQAWAAYFTRVYTGLKSDPQTARLDTPENSQSPPHKRTLHSETELGTIPSPINSGRIVHVKLNGKLSAEEKEIVERLRKRDAEVRRHEQAHLVTAGQYALGAPSYSYQVGPNGQRYAVGGEVQVDLSPVQGDAEATLRKARQLQQAALAPSEPSATDRQVAMMASRMAQEAQQELAEEKIERRQDIAEKKAEADRPEGDGRKTPTNVSQTDGKEPAGRSDAHTEPVHSSDPSAPQIAVQPGVLPPSLHACSLDIYV